MQNQRKNRHSSQDVGRKTRGLGYRGPIFAVVGGLILLCCFLILAVQGIAGERADSGQGVNMAHAAGPLPAWMRAPAYRYDPKGKPDPFVPFIRKEDQPPLRPLEVKPTRKLTPLEKVDVTQLRAIGIIWYPKGNRESMAMVQLPDGKGFVLKKGMRIGRKNGIVDVITPEAIIVKENGLDMLGKEKIRDVRIRLHSEKGGTE